MLEQYAAAKGSSASSEARGHEEDWGKRGGERRFRRVLVVISSDFSRIFMDFSWMFMDFHEIPCVPKAFLLASKAKSVFAGGVE